MREGLSRLWLVLILAAFGVPLFIGLGSTDLANDEAIYSYAVESILTTGDWLSPLSSPSDFTFLEKPPLKFWIVAAPIHFGLLPYNEFSLRIWDALFGTLAFVYVFLIGQRLSGPICGVVAVLILFAHTPLIFEHGFRSNNMDAALVLAYCGGVYHYLRWSSAGAGSGRTWHIAAVGGMAFLGFMTKFVAVLFLPAIIGVATLVLPAQRRQLARDWWRWIAAGIAAFACAFPWFYYQHTLHGSQFWRIMFGEHVYQRFTTFTDPGHVQPWYFYISAAYTEFLLAGSALWVGLGLGVLLVETTRRRTPERVVVVLWWVLPVTLISMGSSKLYHYLYPFLPPLALAAGAGVAWIVAMANERIGARAWLDRRPSGWLRAGVWALTAAAVAVAVATLINDGVRLYAGPYLLFRNTSLLRPLLIAALGITLAANLRAPAAVIGLLIVQMIVPTPLRAYEANLRQMKVRHRPLGALAECLREVHAAHAAPGAPAGVVPAIARHAFGHPYFYYLRGTGWLDGGPDDERLREALLPGRPPRPVVIDRAGYERFVARAGPLPEIPVVTRVPGILVLLPGPYGVCRGTTELVGR